jgi:hypothetical protein
MKHKPEIVPPSTIHFFFLIGLLSSISFRLLIVFQHIAPALIRPTWYAGVIGYVIFFLYRYFISRKRKNAIKEYDLIAKIMGSNLSEEDKQVSTYLLSSIQKSPENLNYFFIFSLSAVAVVFDILFICFSS